MTVAIRLAPGTLFAYWVNTDFSRILPHDLQLCENTQCRRVHFCFLLSPINRKQLHFCPISIRNCIYLFSYLQLIAKHCSFIQSSLGVAFLSPINRKLLRLCTSNYLLHFSHILYQSATACLSLYPAISRSRHLDYKIVKSQSNEMSKIVDTIESPVVVDKTWQLIRAVDCESSFKIINSAAKALYTTLVVLGILN